MVMAFSCDIVSLEKSIFRGMAESLIVVGEIGELSIHYSHAPLLTTLKPGPARLVKENGEEEVFYISGGFIEVQPTLVTILADTVIRAADISEAAAKKSRDDAQKLLTNQHAEFDYSQAAIKLAEASAQLRTIDELRKKK